MSQTSNFNCRDVIFERKIDLCKLTDVSKNSMFVNIVLQNMRNFTNFDLECPYKAGVYTYTNFTFSHPRVIPFPVNAYMCFKAKMFAKTSLSKKFEQFCEVSADVSYEI